MFAIAKITGDGSDENPWSPDINEDGFRSGMNAYIPSKLDGSPKFNWCLIWCKDIDVFAGTDLLKFPKNVLNMTVADIPQAKRIAINNKLTALGIDTSSITLSTPLRKIIKWMGVKLNINFKTFGGVDFSND